MPGLIHLVNWKSWDGWDNGILQYRQLKYSRTATNIKLVEGM